MTYVMDLACLEVSGGSALQASSREARHQGALQDKADDRRGQRREDADRGDQAVVSQTPLPTPVRRVP